MISVDYKMEIIMNKILLCLFLIHKNTAYSANCEHDSQDLALYESASRGDAGAQIIIGSDYDFGNGAPKDFKTADDWSLSGFINQVSRRM